MTDDDRHAPLQRRATFRFYAELNDHLPADRRKARFDHAFTGTPSVRDAIQAIGVPHAEVDLVLVDGVSVDFSHRLHGGEDVAVYPVFERLDIAPLVRLRPRPLRRTRFVLDANLGKLARYLRMLGFDTLWRQGAGAEGIVEASLEEGRTILTRDVDLLKRRRVTHGHWLRHHLPEEQLEEVLLAFDLLGALQPFSRCMSCNGVIEPVADRASIDDVEPAILARFDAFWRCGDCGKLYWRGSHFRRMEDLVRRVASAALVRALCDPAAFPHEVGEIQVVETHISWVVLTGEFAYKVKKPVELGFLDFSTLALRRRFCEEELRVNRRTAPSIYLGVVPIGPAPHGVRVGAEPALDYAVKMRQFPHAARLDRRLEQGAFGDQEARELAQMVAAFHQSLPPLEQADDEPERTIRPARNNFRHLEPSSVSDRFQQKLAVVESWTLDEADALAPAIRERASGGRVRECHGDLHLENIVHLDGRFVLFDAIEFNPELRRIDVANDIAFLVMDLLARGRQGLAYGLLNAWLEAIGDYDGLTVMRFYLVYRAMVRAVVTAIRRSQQPVADDAEPGPGAAPAAARSFRPGPERYIGLAAELVDTPPPQLILMHGFSGSGKTWTSERLVRELPALRVRSDLERKRLAGRAPGERTGAGVGQGLYAPEVSERTYEALARCCEAGLRAGFSMIADATFLERRQRQRFVGLGQRIGARVGIVDCQADAAILRQRISSRMAEARDASEADLAVLEHQMRHHEALDADERRLLLHLDRGPPASSLSS